MKPKTKVLTAVLLCCVLVLAFIACAGCTGNESSAQPVVAQPTQTPVASSGGSALTQYTLTVTDNIVGDRASELITTANKYNKLPSDGMTAYLVQYKVSCDELGNLNYIQTNGDLFTPSISLKLYVDGIGYEPVTAVMPTGYSSGSQITMFPGDTEGGWAYFIAPTASDPYLQIKYVNSRSNEAKFTPNIQSAQGSAEIDPSNEPIVGTWVLSNTAGEKSILVFGEDKSFKQIREYADGYVKVTQINGGWEKNGNNLYEGGLTKFTITSNGQSMVATYSSGTSEKYTKYVTYKIPTATPKSSTLYKEHQVAGTWKMGTSSDYVKLTLNSDKTGTMAASSSESGLSTYPITWRYYKTGDSGVDIYAITNNLGEDSGLLGHVEDADTCIYSFINSDLKLTLSRV